VAGLKLRNGGGALEVKIRRHTAEMPGGRGLAEYQLHSTSAWSRLNSSVLEFCLYCSDPCSNVGLSPRSRYWEKELYDGCIVTKPAIQLDAVAATNATGLTTPELFADPTMEGVHVLCRKDRTYTHCGEQTECLFIAYALDRDDPVLVERWVSISVEVSDLQELTREVGATDLPETAIVGGFPSFVRKFAARALSKVTATSELPEGVPLFCSQHHRGSGILATQPELEPEPEPPADTGTTGVSSGQPEPEQAERFIVSRLAGTWHVSGVADGEAVEETFVLVARLGETAENGTPTSGGCAGGSAPGAQDEFIIAEVKLVEGGPTLAFTQRYPNGDETHWTVVLDPDHLRMSDGRWDGIEGTFCCHRQEVLAEPDARQMKSTPDPLDRDMPSPLAACIAEDGSVTIRSAFDTDKSDDAIADSIRAWFAANENYEHVCWGELQGNPGDQLAELVRGFLFLSSEDAADDCDELSARSIGAVVNCIAGLRSNADRAYFESTIGHSVEAICDIDAEDAEDYPLLASHLAEFTLFVEQQRAAKRQVLVHCRAGVNRSATLCIAYMIKQLRWPLSVAVQHAFLARPMILSNDGFLLQLIVLARAEGLLEGTTSLPFDCLRGLMRAAHTR
jgi:protein-tyrosine phosphatase